MLALSGISNLAGRDRCAFSSFSRRSTKTIVDSLPVNQRNSAPDRLEIMQGTLDLIILRTLRWGPMHGHGIVKFIQQTSGDTFKIEHGSLYPALQRLLQERWITAEWGVSTKNRKARFYSLTPAGRKQLSAEHSKWERFSEAISRILTSARAKDA